MNLETTFRVSIPYVCYTRWCSCCQKQEHCILAWIQLFIQHILYECSLTPGTELPGVQYSNIRLPVGQFCLNYKSLQCHESKTGFIRVTSTCFSSQVSSPVCLYLHSQCHLSWHPGTHLYILFNLSHPSQESLGDAFSFIHAHYLCSDHLTSYLAIPKTLCTGILDSRLFPFQYFPASTVHSGILYALLFSQEGSKSLEGQDYIFLFIIFSRSQFLAYARGSVNIACWTLMWDRWKRREGQKDSCQTIHLLEIVCH